MVREKEDPQRETGSKVDGNERIPALPHKAIVWEEWIFIRGSAVPAQHHGVTSEMEGPRNKLLHYVADPY